MALDIVSYGRRGPSGTLRFGADQIAQIQRTVGRTPEVMVKVSGGGRDVGGVEAHLRYIGRHGKLPVETDEGLTQQGRGAAKEITADWQLDLCRSQYKPKPAEDRKDTRSKLVHNIVLSMPAGTPAEKVLAAARVFARENFALQHRYAMVLHNDQAHPHVHLVVKCEHEFEPGRRLYIRKATLRQWREQFAALLREQGVTANATPRQVRGQIRTPYRDAIHHRLRALRAFGQLPADERARRQPPRSSTFMRAKLDGVLQVLRSGRGSLDAGKEVMQSTRQEVAADWHTTADALRKQSEHDLAARVDRFLARMPLVQTDGRRMAERWKEQGRIQALERANSRSPDQQVR
ncbi:relaxase/mobilization nuclease domain-containing protein [Variovorax sp. RA8]|uniref:relaxase/mobilization nuclease domain-containing protein n=1 Tax=Variovorax sp. (strain JCM 16519 / RA8) TaxID=662548 RepID=UPI001318FC83|nr:relaxase/mobilization nuclease domain-containing protein [Variovorax sp. RA8]VTU14416.1 Relaxase/Mobilisation nuclease domain protein [Variovorax sp. RA8]